MARQIKTNINLITCEIPKIADEIINIPKTIKKKFLTDRKLLNFWKF